MTLFFSLTIYGFSTMASWQKALRRSTQLVPVGETTSLWDVWQKANVRNTDFAASENDTATQDKQDQFASAKTKFKREMAAAFNSNKLPETKNKPAAAPQPPQKQTRPKNSNAGKHQVPDPTMNGWHSLLECSFKSAWQQYHSKGFYPVARSCYVLVRNPYVFVYTPYAATKNKVFNRTLLDAINNWLAGKNSATGAPEKKYHFRLPYFPASSPGDLAGIFYLAASPSNTLQAKPGFVPGALPQKNQEALYQMAQNAGLDLSKLPGFGNTPSQREAVEYAVLSKDETLWINSNSSTRLNPMAKRLFIEEVEKQIVRFNKKNAADQKSGHAGIHAQKPWFENINEAQLMECKNAAEQLNMKTLGAGVTKQRQLSEVAH